MRKRMRGAEVPFQLPRPMLGSANKIADTPKATSPIGTLATPSLRDTGLGLPLAKQAVGIVQFYPDCYLGFWLIQSPFPLYINNTSRYTSCCSTLIAWLRPLPVLQPFLICRVHPSRHRGNIIGPLDTNPLHIIGILLTSARTCRALTPHRDLDAMIPLM